MQKKLRDYSAFRKAIDTYENNVSRLAKHLTKPRMKKLKRKRKQKSNSVTLTITEYLEINNRIEAKHFKR